MVDETIFEVPGGARTTCQPSKPGEETDSNFTACCASSRLSDDEWVANWAADKGEPGICRRIVNNYLTGTYSGLGDITRTRFLRLQDLMAPAIARALGFISKDKNNQIWSALNQLRGTCGTESDRDYFGLCSKALISECNTTSNALAKKLKLTPRDVIINDSILGPFCGCYAPRMTFPKNKDVDTLAKLYYNAHPQCDSLCTVSGTIQLGKQSKDAVGMQTFPIPCQQNVCLMDDVKIIEQGASSKGISFNQICNVCKGQGCVCILHARTYSDLTKAARDIHVNRVGHCDGTKSIYYDGATGQIFKGSRVDPEGSSADSGSSGVKIALVILLVVLVLVLVVAVFWFFFGGKSRGAGTLSHPGYHGVRMR